MTKGSAEVFVNPEASDRDWVVKARCRGLDPELFFPERGAQTVDLEEPKRLCAGCPVRVECLRYALRVGVKEGIWGGLSSKERRVLRRRWLLEGRDDGVLRRSA